MLQIAHVRVEGRQVAGLECPVVGLVLGDGKNASLPKLAHQLRQGGHFVRVLLLGRSAGI